MKQVTDYAVVVAGGGPVGLMLAGELALGGADVVIVERRKDQGLDGSRAGGLHARTIEILDQRGIADRFLSEGETHPIVGFGGTVLGISDFPSRHSYLLALWQSKFEPILAGWVAELGVPIMRSREVVGLSQDSDGVNVDVSDGTSLRAEYLVGCDGGPSTVRKAAGIDFVGWDASSSWITAEVVMVDEPQIGLRPEGGGIGPINREKGGNPYGVTLLDDQVETGKPTPDDLRTALISKYGTDFGMQNPNWISRFSDASRHAAEYRKGRVLLAGDAAHIHGPQSGQGLNTGVQDAVNLGWKLAQVVSGMSSPSLLDSYHAERHPVAARVIQNTMAQVAMNRTDDRSKALRDATLELLRIDEPRKRIAGMISGLDITYDLGGEHPLVGRRMPDMDLKIKDGATRVYELLHDAKHLLLNFGEPNRLDASWWSPLLRTHDADSEGEWDLPVIGVIPAPTAVLIRPDGYVAWVEEQKDVTLDEALTMWIGP